MFNLFFTFLRIGAFTFGGGYAMVSLIQDELVKHQKLLSDDEFLDYLSLAQSFPGVLAVNISILIGYKLYKIPGVIVCVLGAALPSFFIVIAVSYIYVKHSSSPILRGFFLGVSPVVIALIINSFLSLFSKIKKTTKNMIFLVLSILLVSIFHISPIYLILAGGAYSLCQK
ncbi:MAG: chromate transporter [Clostridioides sp.]|nr:chromate transporter [Clostridioides sp.]